MEYRHQAIGVEGEIPTASGWKELLEGAVIKDMAGSIYQVDTLSKRWEGPKDLLGVGHKARYLLRSATFRRFVKETLSAPKNLPEYFGYGIYICRK